jgi:hypothetical protein
MTVSASFILCPPHFYTPQTLLDEHEGSIVCGVYGEEDEIGEDDEVCPALKIGGRMVIMRRREIRR